LEGKMMKAFAALILISLALNIVGQQLPTLSVEVVPSLENAQYEYHVADLGTKEVLAWLKTQFSQASFQLPPGNYIVFVEAKQPGAEPMVGFAQVPLLEDKQIMVNVKPVSDFVLTTGKESIATSTAFKVKVLYFNGSPAEDALILVKPYEEIFTTGAKGEAYLPTPKSPVLVIALKQNFQPSSKLVLPEDNAVTLTLEQSTKTPEFYEYYSESLVVPVSKGSIPETTEHEFGIRTYTYSPLYLAVQTGALIIVAAAMAFVVAIFLRKRF